MAANDKGWVVYILLCGSDNSLYVGATNNIHKRIIKHQSGKGAKRTRGRGPIVLLTVLPTATKSDALKEEHRIKKLSRNEKLKLCLKPYILV